MIPGKTSVAHTPTSRTSHMLVSSDRDLSNNLEVSFGIVNIPKSKEKP